MDVVLVGLVLNIGLAALGFLVLYLVLRRAVRDGMLDAWAERPRQAALQAGVERMRRSDGEPGGSGHD
ncbi:hypothetical protein [Actinotalea ferrariae]|uniref:hypothetical protein n=1 Tax=Actinotalea ferrariae TaxID=1386098 RepID=UPI0012DECC01|nr:hypothetical protein [Actinotalea ferrariae]